MIVMANISQLENLALEDAQKFYNQVKRYHPNTVKSAHEILAEFLKEHDDEKYKIFLGQKSEPTNVLGFSNIRFELVFVHLDICRHLEYVEKEKLPAWTENSMDWLLRKLLKIPFKTIKGKS